MELSQLKILYIGPDYPGSNGTCWRDAFVELGHDVRTVDSEDLVPWPRNLSARILGKIIRRPPGRLVSRLNEAIIRSASEFKPDFTFYIQARFVLPDTLEKTAKLGPNLVYFNDDMFNPDNQTFTFRESLKLIDCILTTKSYNVSEFYESGAPLALYIPNAYDPQIHFPAKPSHQDWLLYCGDVAFIGTFRVERADFLARVASYPDEFKFNIWGSGWWKMHRPLYCHRLNEWQQLKKCIRGQELWCAEMGKAIQSNKICLGLLNHANRDLQTSRSFEIPACNGFMLAERTHEHQEYFEEDKEAVYFSSSEELLDKIRYYLTHESERAHIADGGYQRCLRSPYRYTDRAKFAIEQMHILRPGSLTPRISTESVCLKRGSPIPKDYEPLRD
ncbi:MAG: glycosyltransferase [candidate division NC10 bacterium]|nr:glycosyltransferase [candidate division NC10 bacterium]MDE2320343.1 glycosyltransferase [candidate division NC10 bacterium]